MSLGFEAANIRHPFEDGGQGNGGHPAPNARTRTVVWADGKRQVSVGIAMDVEAVWVGEVSLVAVRGTDIRHHI